ncbi:MAG TPA: zf-HC2 domain-containing protein [Pyrinomonadaceae bacterium]
MKDRNLGNVTGEATVTRACARADELVTYLYGEADAEAAKDFERHAEACVDCRGELAEFGVLRSSVGAWREQTIGSIAFPARGEESQAGVARARLTPPVRSAFVALREFFRLSPDWMRAATAFAALTVCALAFVAFSHFYSRPRPDDSIANRAAEKTYTQGQVDAMVADVLKKEREAGQSQSLSEKSRELAVQTPPVSQKDVTNGSQAPRRATANGGLIARHRSPGLVIPAASAQERQQLAEVLLPQESARDDDGLPQLSDLIGSDPNP